MAKNEVGNRIPTPLAFKKKAGATIANVLASKRTSEKKRYDEAVRFGRVDADGNVFVKDGDIERQIGQYKQDDLGNALNLYIRRYLDILNSFDLFYERLTSPSVSASKIDETIKSIEKSIQNPSAVGDLSVLPEKLAKAREVAEKKKKELAEVHRDAVAKEEKARYAIVQKIEKMAKDDRPKSAWKTASRNLNSLIDEWRERQASNVRIDSELQEKLWSRIFEARKEFEQKRREFFSDLDEKSAEAKRAKEALIERAQKLSDSTDFENTPRKFAELMREWKRAGHARPKEDDSLWEQFKAAQDKFFDAKDVEDSAVGEEYEKNYEAKLLILENAKKILPVKDIKKARAELRIIQQKWDEIGRVPRTKLAGIESRLEKIESAIRKAEEDAWDKTNSALSERQDSVLTQLNAGIEKLEAKIKTLTDSKAIENAKEELDSKLALLKMFKGESK